MQANIDEAAMQEENVEVVAEADKVTMMALMNSLILDKVFRLLDTNSLKSVRLVCATWADVGAPFLGKQSCFKFFTSSDFYYAKHNLDTSETSLNPKLAKNITVKMYYDKCDQNSSNEFPSSFGILLPSICDKLETLRFSGRKPFEPRLHEMWTTFDFPHLTRISIFATNMTFNKQEDELTLKKPEFRPLTNLKELSLEIVPGGESNLSGADLSSTCQGLLNAAQNLEKFTLKSFFYPDLTPCRKLKKFNFQYEEYEDCITKHLIEIDISEITKMLKSCPTSLEKLTLNCYPPVVDTIAPAEKLNFRFPNLTHLKVNAADMYKVEDSVNVTNLPRLTHFSINSFFDMSKMTENYYMRHPGVTSLNVVCSYHGNEDRQAAAKLANLFPAVREYSLKLRIVLDEDDIDFLPLREMMEAFGGWELTCGQVDIQHGLWNSMGMSDLDDANNEFDPEVMIVVMEGMSEWRGLPNTSLNFVGYRAELEVQLTNRMRDAFLLCRTIKSMIFDDFQIDEDTWEDLNEFIEENNLPVSIPNFDAFW